MMWREQKTVEVGWSLGDKVEPEVSKGARSIETLETAEGNSTELLEQVLSIENMFNARKGGTHAIH
jgi:hypothetical protein